MVLTEAVCADIALNLEQVRNHHQQSVDVDDKADDGQIPLRENVSLIWP